MDSEALSRILQHRKPEVAESCETSHEICLTSYRNLQHWKPEVAESYETSHEICLTSDSILQYRKPEVVESCETSIRQKLSSALWFFGAMRPYAMASLLQMLSSRASLRCLFGACSFQLCF